MTGENGDQLATFRDLLEDTNRKVGQMHTVVFGAEGQGGLIREHEKFANRTNAKLEELDRHKEEVNTFKAKVLGVVLAVSTIVTLLGNKLIAFFTQKNP